MAEDIAGDVATMTIDIINVTVASQTEPGWMVIFDNVQLAFTIVGVLANSATLITLMKNGDGFSEIICLLLKYQSAVDAVVSLLGFLLGVLPPFWSVGNVAMDTLICQLWHGTFLYWSCIAMSIYNLVLLAVERYICICHPLKYTLITKTKICLMIVGCFFYAQLITVGALFNSQMRGGICVGNVQYSPRFKRFMAFFSISTFFTFWLIPTVLFVTLYGLIVYQLRQRAKLSLGTSTNSAVIDKASSELTKTVIVVTIIYLIAFTYDVWYYLLGYLGVTEYIINSPLQKIGTFLSVINSMVNPFVYASLMPVYRRSVQKTFMICFHGRQRRQQLQRPLYWTRRYIQNRQPLAISSSYTSSIMSFLPISECRQGHGDSLTK